MADKLIGYIDGKASKLTVIVQDERAVVSLQEVNAEPIHTWCHADAGEVLRTVRNTVEAQTTRDIKRASPWDKFVWVGVQERGLNARLAGMALTRAFK